MNHRLKHLDRKGSIMNANDQERFWQLYEKQARPALMRACRSASRRLTSGTMDAGDMGSWIDQRVWRLLEKQAAPLFDNDPTPEEAIERVVNSASLLARWAYMAMSRKHFRRAERQRTYLNSMSRAERLSMVSDAGGSFEETEQIKDDLAQIAKSLGTRTSAQLAASWPEKSERNRIAMALGVTDKETDELIDRATSGDMKENTVQQMRSRARKRAAEVLAEARRHATLIMAIAGLSVFSLATSPARGGEQSGGRRGGMTAPAMFDVTAKGGEQSGGRGGMVAPTLSLLAKGGEQSGGRGG
ncbi:MAG: hypothetical protein ACIARR_02330 [Phycisphaerales bacterium JB059]